MLQNLKWTENLYRGKAKRFLENISNFKFAIDI